MKDYKQFILYQNIYRTKNGLLIESKSNKMANLEENEDLILFQVADANLGYNVFRYGKAEMKHIKWFEDRDQAIEFAFTESMKEQMDLEKAPIEENSKVEPFKKLKESDVKK